MKKILSYAAIVLMIIACGEKPTPDVPDEPEVPDVTVDESPATFNATFAALTKASFNGSALQWTASDEISVFSCLHVVLAQGEYRRGYLSPLS